MLIVNRARVDRAATQCSGVTKMIKYSADPITHYCDDFPYK